eukprot:scaffold158_cov388-Prasinococcus_capsulatus_cf.AAC.1
MSLRTNEDLSRFERRAGPAEWRSVFVLPHEGGHRRAGGPRVRMRLRAHVPSPNFEWEGAPGDSVSIFARPPGSRARAGSGGASGGVAGLDCPPDVPPGPAVAPPPALNG